MKNLVNFLNWLGYKEVEHVFFTSAHWDRKENAWYKQEAFFKAKLDSKNFMFSEEDIIHMMDEMFSDDQLYTAFLSYREKNTEEITDSLYIF